MNKITILPVNKEELLEQRERGITQTSFKSEYILFCCIRDGAVELLKQGIDDYFSQPMIMGRMSGNNLRQIQYWAVATISVAVHYAILGNFDETEAFTMSDEVIRKVDVCSDSDEIFMLIKEKALILCEKVRENNINQAGISLTPVIRKALHFIHNNIFTKIKLDDISSYCGVSSGYVSKEFKKQTGMNFSEYVVREKTKQAKIMLLDDISYSDICYRLGFCSESHFIACFVKVEGITPKKYKLQML